MYFLWEYKSVRKAAQFELIWNNNIVTRLFAFFFKLPSLHWFTFFCQKAFIVWVTYPFLDRESFFTSWYMLSCAISTNTIWNFEDSFLFISLMWSFRWPLTYPLWSKLAHSHSFSKKVLIVALVQTVASSMLFTWYTKAQFFKASADSTGKNGFEIFLQVCLISKWTP